MLGGCAALAFGLVGGWTVLAVLPGKAPQNLANVEGPRQGIPDPTTADERAAVTSPSPSSAAPASPAPPLPTATKQNPGERSAAASGPMGVWIDHTGRGAVEISECAGGLCGRIVWLQDSGHKGACGKQIIGDAKRTATGTWDGGWIYDPDRKARFSVELKPIGADKLRVVGYQGSKFFSETFTWKRPVGELKRCDADAPVLASTPSTSPNPDAQVKAEPAPDQDPETPIESKSRKSGNPNIAALGNMASALKFQKRQVNGKSQCTVKAPYVGTVIIPCPE